MSARPRESWCDSLDLLSLSLHPAPGPAVVEWVIYTVCVCVCVWGCMHCARSDRPSRRAGEAGARMAMPYWYGGGRSSIMIWRAM